MAAAHPSNCIKVGSSYLKVANLVTEEMTRLYDVEPGAIHYTVAFTLNWEARSYTRALKLLDDMKTAGMSLTTNLDSRIPVWPLSAMIVDTYSRAGRWSEATRAFDVFLAEAGDQNLRGAFAEPLAHAMTAYIEAGDFVGAKGVLEVLAHNLQVQHKLGAKGFVDGQWKDGDEGGDANSRRGDIGISFGPSSLARNMTPAWFVKTVKALIKAERWDLAAATISNLLFHVKDNHRVLEGKSNRMQGGLTLVQSALLPFLDDNLEHTKDCIAALTRTIPPPNNVSQVGKPVQGATLTAARQQERMETAFTSMGTAEHRRGIMCRGDDELWATATSWETLSTGGQGGIDAHGIASIEPNFVEICNGATSSTSELAGESQEPAVTQLWPNVRIGKGNSSLWKLVRENLRSGSILKALEILDSAEAKAATGEEIEVSTEPVVRSGGHRTELTADRNLHKVTPSRWNMKWLRVAWALDMLDNAQASMTRQDVLPLVVQASQEGADAETLNMLMACAMEQRGPSIWASKEAGVVDLTSLELKSPAAAVGGVRLILNDMLQHHIRGEKVKRFVHTPSVDLIIIVSLTAGLYSEQMVVALESLLRTEFRGLMSIDSLVGRLRVAYATEYNRKKLEARGVVVTIPHYGLRRWLQVEGEACSSLFKSTSWDEKSMEDIGPPSLPVYDQAT
ncbi:unnamed protein product [Choristocarpus tenellus]